MTGKFERVQAPSGSVVLRVIGRIDGTRTSRCCGMEQEKTKKSGLAIDLTEVTLVSQEAVEALAVAETNGIELRNCPGYIREWVSRTKESHD